MSVHRTLGSQKAGVILTKKDERNLHETINFAVFPQMQGGPHNHRIASTAATMLFAQSEDFQRFAFMTKKNSLALQEGILKQGQILGYKGKSDTHIVYMNSMNEHFNEKEIEIASQVAGLEVSVGPKGALLGTLETTRRGMD